MMRVLIWTLALLSMMFFHGNAKTNPLRLMLIHNPSCGYCRKLDSEVIPEVIDYFKSQGFDVTLELIDWSNPLQQNSYYAMQRTHQVLDENITGYPVLIILNPNGSEHSNCRIYGYMPKNLYINALETRIPSCV